MGRMRTEVAAAIAVAAAVVAPVASTPAAGAEADSGWHVLEGDMVIHEDALAPTRPGPQAAVPLGGPGYVTLQAQQNIGAYTFVLEVDADTAGYRDDVVEVAAELNALLGPRGGSFTVQVSAIDLTQQQIDDPSPGPNELLVLRSATSPCGGTAPNWIGCGGPRSFEDVSGDDGIFYMNSGVIWLRDTLAGSSAAIQAEVVHHEIGHALGLDHFNTEFEGEFQVMRSGAGLEGANQTFQSGDENGFLAQHAYFVDNDAFTAPRLLGPETNVTAPSVTRFASGPEPGEPSHAGAAALRSTWFTFVAPRAGFTTVSTAGANFDSRVAVYTGDAVGSLTPVAANDDGPGLGTASLVGFQATAGTTYRIAVDGKAGSFGAGFVRVRPPSTVSCDDVSTACVVPAAGVRVQALDTTGTTEEVGEPNHAPGFPSQNFLGTMWFTWTAPRSGPARVVTERSGTSPFTGIYTGPNVLGLTTVPTTLVQTQTTRRLDFTAAAGTTYRIGVVASPSSANFTLTVDPGFGGLTPVTPARVLETRNPPGCIGISCGPNGVRWPANQPFPVDVTGVGGVPELGVSAVVLNVTVADAFGSGFLSLYPTGQAPPTASNLNYAATQAVANLVTVKVGADGRINILSNGGFPNVIADIVGWYGPATGSLLTPVPPARIQESRSEPGISPIGQSGAWGPLQTRNIQVTGQAGVPADATAVVLNVTATGTTAPSFLTVWPAGVTRPTASNLNWVAGQTVPNLVVVGTGAGGEVSIFNNGGSAHVIADVVGYYGGAGGSPVTAVAPVRLLDTRDGTGLSGPFGAQSTRTLAVSGGPSPVPASATGVLLNVTVTQPTSGSFLTAFPAGANRPNASNLNFVAGQTVPNLVLVKVGPGGVSLYNHDGSTHVIADVVGYVAD